MAEKSNIIVLEEEVFTEMVEKKLKAVLEAVAPRFFLEEEVLTMEGAARVMKCSKSTVQKMLQNGTLTPHRPGHDPRFLKSEIFEFVRKS